MAAVEMKILNYEGKMVRALHLFETGLIDANARQW